MPKTASKKVSPTGKSKPTTPTRSATLTSLGNASRDDLVDLAVLLDEIDVMADITGAASLSEREQPDTDSISTMLGMLRKKVCECRRILEGGTA